MAVGALLLAAGLAALTVGALGLLPRGTSDGNTGGPTSGSSAVPATAAPTAGATPAPTATVFVVLPAPAATPAPADDGPSVAELITAFAGLVSAAGGTYAMVVSARQGRPVQPPTP